MSIQKLKPCPFCGGDVEWCKDDDSFHMKGDDCHHITCERCGSFDLHIINSDDWSKIYSSLAEQWNIRDQDRESLVLKIKELIALDAKREIECGARLTSSEIIMCLQNLINPAKELTKEEIE